MPKKQATPKNATVLANKEDYLQTKLHSDLKPFDSIEDFKNKRHHRITFQSVKKPYTTYTYLFANEKEANSFWIRLKELENSNFKNFNKFEDRINTKKNIPINSVYFPKGKEEGIFIDEESVKNYSIPEDLLKIKPKPEKDKQEIKESVETKAEVKDSTLKSEVKTENNVANEVKENKTEQKEKEKEQKPFTFNDEGLNKYEKLFLIEDDLMKYLKENYKIPNNISDEKLLNLIHHNFTASKVGNLDVENFNDLLNNDKLYLYDYVNVDEKGNLINGLQQGNKQGLEAIVFEPKQLKAEKGDLAKLSDTQLKEHLKAEETRMEKIRELRHNLNQVKPQILQDLYNHSIDKRLDYFKNQIKNEKKPINVNRYTSFLTDLLKNRYLFIGSLLFWPSTFIYLGIALLVLQAIKFLDKSFKTNASKQRLKNLKENINKTINDMNKELNHYYFKGKNMIKDKKENVNIDNTNKGRETNNVNNEIKEMNNNFKEKEEVKKTEQVKEKQKDKDNKDIKDKEPELEMSV